jgi:hypothetical protein
VNKEESMSDEREHTIGRILDIEADMFLRVRTADDPSCRADLESMKLHRRGQFATWSTETCESYLRDLRAAEERGENLMTIKYARMDELIPPYSENGLIDEILERYRQWQREMIRDYPNIMRGGRDLDDFGNYLRGELETYSDETLALLRKDVEACSRRGENMAKQVYEYLARQSGYESIGQLERALEKS